MQSESKVKNLYYNVFNKRPPANYNTKPCLNCEEYGYPCLNCYARTCEECNKRLITCFDCLRQLPQTKDVK